MVLDLLTQNAPDGISFENLRTHLLRQYAFEEDTATDALNGFLKKLEDNGLLSKLGKPAKGGVKDIDDDNYPNIPKKTRKHKEKAKLDIVVGGTTITTGYVIVWYRP